MFCRQHNFAPLHCYWISFSITDIIRVHIKVVDFNVPHLSCAGIFIWFAIIKAIENNLNFVWGKDGMWTQTKFACQLLAISNLIHQIVLNMTYTQTGASNCVLTLCNFCKEHLEGLQQHKLHCKFQLLVTRIILSLTDTTVHTTLDDFFDKVCKCYSSILWIHVAI